MGLGGAALSLLIITVSLFLCWMALSELLTLFSEAGVSQLTLTGEKFIAWGNVTHVFGQRGILGADIITIKDRHQPIRINLLTYKNPEKLISLLETYVPPSVIRK